MEEKNVLIDIESAQDMHDIGVYLGEHLRAGDVIMLNGPLGAGKTTLTQGIGEGMGVCERISSPTYVIAVRHRGRQINLVHVDAYRLGGAEELDDLDLDSTLEDSVLVFEWGQGKAEALSADRLEIQIVRPEGSDEGVSIEDLYADAPRQLRIAGCGERSRFLTALLEDYDSARHSKTQV